MKKVESLSKKELVDLVADLRLKLLTATKNLGHPLYNVSSSNTFRIDELREEFLNYLQATED